MNAIRFGGAKKIILKIFRKYKGLRKIFKKLADESGRMQ